MNKDKNRPLAVSILCALLTVSLIISIYNSFFPFDYYNWLAYFSILTNISLIIVIIGIWQMKKWGMAWYFFIAAIVQLTLFVSGLWGGMMLVMPFITVVIFIVYYKRFL